jgi:hypothetical protein
MYAKYQKLTDPQVDAVCRHNFVFHMTDWKRDLEKLAEFYKHPERFDMDSAGDIVVGFLYHALSHVRAAARLLLDWEPEDIFKDLDGKVEPQAKPTKAHSRPPKAAG